MPSAVPQRGGYLTVDAMVGLAIGTIAIIGTVSLAADVYRRVADAHVRLEHAQIVRAIYEDIYAGHIPDGQHGGQEKGLRWHYSSVQKRGDTAGFRAVRIEARRTGHTPLVIDVVMPPAPATASSS